MKSLKRLLIALALTFGLSTSAAQAAECQLRNLDFVSTVNSGYLVVNAEMWGISNGAWTKLGNLANVTYCSVNGTYNGISAATCKNWYQLALATMLANKKIYITANACTVGNGPSFNLTNIGYFGLNH
jgi:hypothetical protein